jgi:hypothetical protein
VRVAVGFDYVLVLEWLREGDERTGEHLHAFLPSVGFPSQLVTCQSWDDIQRALAAAALAVGDNGVPVVHLETHGSDPWVGAPEDIGFGPTEASRVAWAELGVVLAPLNAASDFRLLFVSAACWGSAVIAAIGAGEHVAPFACAVGFRTGVFEGRLRDSMKELYRSMRQGFDLEESAANARRELVEGQEVRLEVTVELAVKMLRTTYYNPNAPDQVRAGPLRRRRRARAVWNQWFPKHLQERDPTYRFENARVGV